MNTQDAHVLPQKQIPSSNMSTTIIQGRLSYKAECLWALYPWLLKEEAQDKAMGLVCKETSGPDDPGNKE